MAQTPRNDDEDKSLIRMTREARHWIEYGVFAFVIITAIATATAAWYTRKEWQSTTDNGRRQLRAYVFPDQANLVWQGTTKPTVAEIVIKRQDVDYKTLHKRISEDEKFSRTIGKWVRIFVS